MYPGTATKKEITPKECRAIFFSANTNKDSEPKVPVLTTPDANITETVTDYCIVIATPGHYREDFSIEINDSLISISAERETVKYGINDRWEYDYTDWTRNIVLPEDADTLLAHSTYQNGELIIRIPRGNTTKNKVNTQIYVY
ncbi:MAG: Hsp20/alpha crystallin family protein [Ferruginibacter sp.]|nr:Hsp20/alpha crystallin family protein [Chitinophagaceae bacterium]